MTPKGGKSSQKILESAFKCIALRGCNNVTLREIADEAESPSASCTTITRTRTGYLTKS